MNKKKAPIDFRFTSLITEAVQAVDSLSISGKAVDETISYNGVKYLAEELRPAAKSLGDKPILKDHRNEVDAIVGTVEKAWFDESEKSVKYTGKIMDRDMQEMINDGRIKHVSIGARVKELAKETKENVNYVIAKGIEFVELSLVAIHGVPNATVTNNSYAATLEEMIKNRGEAFMVNEPEADVPRVEPEEPESEEQLGEIDVLKAEVEKLKAEVEKLKAKLGAEEQEDEEKPEEVTPPEEEKKPEEETEKLRKQVKALEEKLNKFNTNLRGRVVKDKSQKIGETFRVEFTGRGANFYDEKLARAKNYGEYLKIKGE